MFLPAAKIPPGAVAESFVKGNVSSCRDENKMSIPMEDMNSPAEWSAVELMMNGTGDATPFPFDVITEYSGNSAPSEDGSSEYSYDAVSEPISYELEESELEKFLMDAFMDVPEISI
jgi:hypothetical protein